METALPLPTTPTDSVKMPVPSATGPATGDEPVPDPIPLTPVRVVRANVIRIGKLPPLPYDAGGE